MEQAIHCGRLFQKLTTTSPNYQVASAVELLVRLGPVVNLVVVVLVGKMALLVLGVARALVVLLGQMVPSVCGAMLVKLGRPAFPDTLVLLAHLVDRLVLLGHRDHRAVQVAWVLLARWVLLVTMAHLEILGRLVPLGFRAFQD